MSVKSEARRDAGFSLIEVLCAVAIAAAAVTVLLNGIGGSLRGAAALDRHLGARIILQSILEDELAAAATAPEHRAGDSGPYRWTLDIAPADAPPGLPPSFRMYQLTASVSWGAGGRITAQARKLAQ